MNLKELAQAFAQARKQFAPKSVSGWIQVQYGEVSSMLAKQHIVMSGDLNEIQAKAKARQKIGLIWVKPSEKFLETHVKPLES